MLQYFTLHVKYIMVYVTVVKIMPVKLNEIQKQDIWNITTQSTIQNKPDIS